MEIPLSAALSGQVPVVIATNHGGVKSTNKSAWSKRSPFMLYGPSGAQESVWKEFSKRAHQAKDKKTGYQEITLATGTKNPRAGQPVWLAGGAIFVAQEGKIAASGMKRAPHYRAFQKWHYDAATDKLIAVTPMAVIK